MSSYHAAQPVHRLSISSDTTIGSQYRRASAAGGGEELILRTPVANGGTPRTGAPTERKRGMYGISTVVTDDNAPPSLMPASFSSLSQNPYLPSSLSTLSTTFTNPGALPKSSTSSGKSVAQRRSVAPPIQISPLRTVLRTEFDEYLHEVGPELERWERERRLGSEGEPDVGEAVGLGIGGIGGDGNAKRKVKEEELPPLSGVPTIFFDPHFNLSNPRTFDLVTEKIQLASPNPDPKVREKEVQEERESRPGLGPLTLADLATDQILQEKLSHYTAVVESHLVREIGLRSSSFFSALSNLQSLHQQGEDCLLKIGELQTALADGVGGSSKRGLGILRSQIRRRGLEKLEEGVRKVEQVWMGLEGVKELVENGEWIGALEVAEDVEHMYLNHHKTTATSSTTSPTTTTTSRRLNLTRIKSLASVPKKLSLLRAQVAKSLESELVGILDHEMERSVSSYISLSGSPTGWKGKGKARESFIPATFTAAALSPTREEGPWTLKEGGGGEDGGAEGDEAGMEVARDRAKDRVRPVVRGLVRADGMEGAVAAWREAVLRDVRSMVREHLPTSETPTAEEEEALTQGRQSLDLGSVSEKSATLAKKLRAMSHPSFLALARDTYLGLLGCIEVIDLHSKILIALAAEVRIERLPKSTTPIDGLLTVPGASTSPVISPVVDLPATNDLTSEISDVVHASAELANLRFSKVIGVRTEVHSQLSLADFVEIFDVSWAFVVQCEVICQRMIVGLRGVMVGQAKTFLQTFHQKRLTESARLVENEQWSACDVGPETQKIVNLILQCAVGDPAELLIGRRRTTAPPTPAAASPTPPATTPPLDAPAEAKQLDIEGREYYAVSAGLACVDVLIEYLQVVINCPLLTTDAMSKVVEFMKSFNSRTCQVVLGAGAMRSAGLKNITAKHLALASQALSIMISLIPYIRETLRRHLNPKQAVMLIEFDKLKRDYQEHQNEIHSKLVAIMSDRLQVHCKTLEGIDWEVARPANKKTGAYMEALVKEHTTLHKVLSRFLLPPTVEFIMMQVFSALNSRLAEELGKIDIKSEEARERMMADVTYLKVKLGELKGMERGTPGAELENLVKSKKTPVPAALSRRSSLNNIPAVPVPAPGTPPPTSAAPETPVRSAPSPGPFSPPNSTPPPAPAPAPAQANSAIAAAPTSAPSSPTPPPEPVRRKSMAERLAEIAKRRTPLTDVSAVPPPPLVATPTTAVREKEMPSLPAEADADSTPTKPESGFEDVQSNGQSGTYGASPYPAGSAAANLPPIPPAAAPTPPPAGPVAHAYSTTYSPTTYSPIPTFPSTPPPRINVHGTPEAMEAADSTPKARGESFDYTPHPEVLEEPSPAESSAEWVEANEELPEEEVEELGGAQGELTEGMSNGNGIGYGTGETSFGYETPAYLTTIGEESETESTENEAEEEDEVEVTEEEPPIFDDEAYAELDEEEGSFV